MPIPEVDKIWMNGELVPWDEAKVHVLTHALHYGSGVFEGIRCYKTPEGPAVFRLDEHLKRLVRSAKLYYMPVPYTRRASSTTRPSRCIEANGLDACYIRPIVFRGYGEMGLFPLNAPVEVAIAAWPWGAYLGDEGIEHGIRAKISSIQSLDHTALARAAKATRPVPQQHPRQDRGDERRLRRGDHAHRARPRRRGLGREHLRGARRRAHDAAAQRRRARGHHPRRRHADGRADGHPGARSAPWRAATW